MATRKQTAAAKRNIKKARTAAMRQRTIAHLPAAVRKDMAGRPLALGHEAANAVVGWKTARGSSSMTRLRRNIPGRSKMGKWDLVEALRKSR